MKVEVMRILYRWNVAEVVVARIILSQMPAFSELLRARHHTVSFSQVPTLGTVYCHCESILRLGAICGKLCTYNEEEMGKTG
jgi:hypothetical protein